MTVPKNIDKLIEGYDLESDLILEHDYPPIHDLLCQKIKNYGKDTNGYGEVIASHLKRTSKIGAKFIVDALGFSVTAGRNFYNANLLHDLGKTHFSYDAGEWQTEHRPTPEERLEKREHTRLGVELLDMALTKSPEELQIHDHIRVTRSLQQHHHERIDGSGYEGLTGDEQGQIIKTICIIDAYDGDMIYSPHQAKQRTREEALKRLKTSEKYKDKLDPDILGKFIDFTLSDR